MGEATFDNGKVDDRDGYRVVPVFLEDVDRQALGVDHSLER